MPSCVGLSGFASPTLRSVFQTERWAAEDLLTEYARWFDAIEMDSTFVRYPSRDTVEGWVRATPPTLAATVRMPREITHVARLAVPEAVTQALDVLEPLGSRLHAVVFTVPMSLGCDVDAFRSVLERVPPHVPTAWEFQNTSWMCPEVVDLLVEHGSAPVVVDRLAASSGEELLPGGHLASKWDLPFLYVRLRRDHYTVSDVMEWGQVLGASARSGRRVYAFFKQSAQSSAYAQALRELLDEAEADGRDD